jgi:hypothetical protein
MANYYVFTMPDGSQITQENNPNPPPGYIPPTTYQYLQGPQGATGPRGLDALPAAFDARYGWANPYMQTDAAYQPQAPVNQQPQQDPYAMAAQGQRVNPISLMSQYSGSSPSQLMSMQSSQLRPQGPSWKMG